MADMHVRLTQYSKVKLKKFKNSAQVAILKMAICKLSFKKAPIQKALVNLKLAPYSKLG